MNEWIGPIALVLGIVVPLCLTVGWIAWLSHREDMERLKKPKAFKGDIGFIKYK